VSKATAAATGTEKDLLLLSFIIVLIIIVTIVIDSIVIAITVTASVTNFRASLPSPLSISAAPQRCLRLQAQPLPPRHRLGHT